MVSDIPYRRSWLPFSLRFNLTAHSEHDQVYSSMIHHITFCPTFLSHFSIVFSPPVGALLTPPVKSGVNLSLVTLFADAAQ